MRNRKKISLLVILLILAIGRVYPQIDTLKIDTLNTSKEPPIGRRPPPEGEDENYNCVINGPTVVYVGEEVTYSAGCQPKPSIIGWDIPCSSSVTYLNSAQTQVKVIFSGNCSSVTMYAYGPSGEPTNPFTVTVLQRLTPGTLLPALQTSDFGDFTFPLQIGPASGSEGNYTRIWQKSADGYNWQNITSATDQIYNPGHLETTQYFRVQVTSGSEIAFSNTSIVMVSGQLPVPEPLVSNENYIQFFRYREPFSVAPNSPTINQALVGLTYYDGMGRSLQQVNVKGAPEATKDIVIPMAYDNMGRQDKNYLPYATSIGVGGIFKANALSAQSTYYSSTPPIGQPPNAYAYAKTVFEASPLGRVLEQGFVGQAWQPAGSRGTTGRTVVTDRFTNNTDDFTYLFSTRKVARYSVNLTSGSPELENNVAYGANQLLVTVTKDENWLSEIIDGRNGTVEEYTDKEGRVILKRIFNKNNGINEMLSTYYVYDNQGNLTFVLPPGLNPDRSSGVPTATELSNFAYQYRYDERNRLIEKQLPGKGREYLVYNKLDQLVATQDANQIIKSPQEWSVFKYDGLGRLVLSGIWTSGYTREAVQATVNAQSGNNHWEERIGTDYTSRSWPTNGVDILQVNYYDNHTVAGIPSTSMTGYSTVLKGLLTASKTRILGTSSFLWTVNYYDNKGQVVRQYNQHYKGAMVSANNYDDITNVYNFTGQITKSTRNHYAGSSSPAVTVVTENTFDHQLRLIDTWKTVNTGTRTLITRNEYNDIGQLVTKKLHSTNSGSTFLTATSFTYNPRGWMKKQVNPLFSMELKYEDGTNSQYNGNISNQYWGPSSTPTLHNYSYLYDKLNRLTSGISDEGFNETISYDVMGNIKTMNRNPMGTNTYAYLGNRLVAIFGFLNGSLGYDANGNLITDNVKGIGIAYNHLNLPLFVGKASTSESMTYTWLANGVKLRKVVGSMTRDYVSGIEYNGANIELIHMEEGRLIPTGGSDYAYQYMLKDHLGNTRVFMDSDGTAKESSDYYPFGLQVARSGHITPSPENRYKYNGKELQTELGLGQYDYGARFYDPVIGRWGAVDPMSEMGRRWSPYTYAFNNPIRFIDPDGMWAVPPSTHLDRYGNVIAKYDDGDDGVYLHGSNISKSQIDQQRQNNDNTGGNGEFIGEMGGVINANLFYKNTLSKNMAEAKSILNPFSFRNNVKSFGKWDLKNNKNTVFGLANDGKTQFSFEGNVMDTQDIGNHHFGAVSLAYGLFPSENFILKQAGDYQIRSGTSKPEWQIFESRQIPAISRTGNLIWTEHKIMLPPYGDDPRDQNWINKGFQYYKNNR